MGRHAGFEARNALTGCFHCPLLGAAVIRRWHGDQLLPASSRPAAFTVGLAAVAVGRPAAMEVRWRSLIGGSERGPSFFGMEMKHNNLLNPDTACAFKPA